MPAGEPTKGTPVNPQTRNPRGRTGRLLATLVAGALASAVGGALTAGPAAASDLDPAFYGPTAPPNAQLGQPYGFYFLVGPQPVTTCALTAGTLPDGITFDATACGISGVATALGSTTFTVTASNESGPDASVEATVTVDQLPGLSSVSVPSATVGQEYAYQLPIVGTSAATVTQVGPEYLPDGLTLDSGGLVHGTPTAAGTLFGWGLRLDSSVGTTYVSLWFTVQGTVPGTISAPPDAVLGQPYSFTFSASGSPAPHFSVNGLLPPGIGFDFL